MNRYSKYIPTMSEIQRSIVSFPSISMFLFPRLLFDDLLCKCDIRSNDFWL